MIRTGDYRAARVKTSPSATLPTNRYWTGVCVVRGGR